MSRQKQQPYNIGMNQAKRIARLADQKDRRRVLQQFGPGFPKRSEHHQDLVKERYP